MIDIYLYIYYSNVKNKYNINKFLLSQEQKLTIVKINKSERSGYVL